MPESEGSRSSPALRRLVVTLGWCTLAGGLLSFLGWALDLPRLTDWYNNGISIQPNAAVAATSAGAGLVLFTLGWRRAAAVLGIVVALLGATALLQFVTGIDLRPLNTFVMFGRSWGQVGIVSPGRMGPPASFCWTLIGIALVLLARAEPSARRSVPILALMTLSLGMLAITGYLYQAHNFYSAPHLTVIALQTAVFITIMSVGLIAAVDEYGPTRLLRDASAAGVIARRATPAIILVAFALGLLRLEAERAGLVDLPTATAARTLAEVVLLLGLLWWTLTTIRRHEIALQQNRRQMTDDLAATSLLQELSTQLVQPGDLNALLEKILSAASTLTGTDKGNIQLVNSVSGAMQIVVHQGLSPQFVAHFANGGWAPTCGAAADRKARVIIEDLLEETALQGMPEFAILRHDDIRATQSTPLVSRDGRLLGVINNHYAAPGRPAEGVLRYVDVLARLAADLIERSQAEEALREADRRKDEFLATLAHELRGPLAPLRNTLEILKRAGGGALQHQARNTMERQVGHLTRLVDDLIDVSRITHNKIGLRMERVELAHVLHQALEGCQTLAASADLRIRVSAPPEPIYLYADPIRLTQVFGNMLNNACKYTDAGGEIWVTAEQTDHEAVVTIKDTGIGIPPEQLHRVFEPFTQIDMPFERSHGGLGIGLTLVKRLVEMHGGTVTARSEGHRRGTEFVVRLPVLDDRRAGDRALVADQPDSLAKLPR